MNPGAVEGGHDSEEPAMQTITTIGLDIAKSVFQVHGIVQLGGQDVPFAPSSAKNAHFSDRSPIVL
jgi:hypothetical protein